jgi:hypothetical protein
MDVRYTQSYFSRNILRTRDHSGDLGMKGSIILKSILRK